MAEYSNSNFGIIASTGRTATTYIAAVLNKLANVTALHEGSTLTEDDKKPLLPSINIENNLCYQNPDNAFSVIDNKRNPAIIDEALKKTGGDYLVDVSYYNPTICHAVLGSYPKSRMVGIIRDCEEFVISSTCIEGEDTLPVGWPDKDKPLSEREKFISLGRIRPKKNSNEHELWKDYSAIEKNIWLWYETNMLLINAKKSFPERVTLIDFSLLKTKKEEFITTILEHFNIAIAEDLDKILSVNDNFKNKKTTGYQIPTSDHWDERSRDMLKEKSKKILSLINE